jgi:hypothetical protein
MSEMQLRNVMLALSLGAVILGAAAPAGAQGAKPAPGDLAPANAGFDVLKGN